jgi:hypothetical protein
MLALDDAALARLVIGTSRVAPHALGRSLAAPPRARREAKKLQPK